MNGRYSRCRPARAPKCFFFTLERANIGGTYCGVHGRDPTGKYVTILDNDPTTTTFTGETTGLAFSPDGKRMYVAFQSPGIILEVTRLDGLSFGGALLDIKYHAMDAAVQL
jgi:sugar lactone lactonase YvrE